MHTQVAVDTQIMRGINASAVLSVLRGESRLSLSEISERTGLSRQAISRALAGLETAGFVTFEPPDATEPRSGRPAQLVRFRSEAGYVLGVSVNPLEIRIALADLVGTMLVQQSIQFDGKGSAIESLIGGIAALLDQRGLQSKDVWAVSVAAPGIIDPEQGYVKFLPSISDLQGDVLARAIGDELGCAVLVDNDLKLATEGEQWLGAPHEVSSLVLIEWGERVGAGVLLNGSLYRGASNDAGDLGFLDPFIRSAGAPEQGDDQSGLGAFESWVGGAQLVALTAEHASRNGSADLAAALAGSSGREALDIAITAVLEGEPAATAAVRELAGRFAWGIAAIRALLDPQLIIIGGPMARCGELLLRALREALAEQVLNQPALEISSLGDDAVVYGAIHRALEHVDRSHFAFNTVTGGVTPKARQHHPINQ